MNPETLKSAYFKALLTAKARNVFDVMAELLDEGCTCERPICPIHEANREDWRTVEKYAVALKNIYEMGSPSMAELP